MRALQALQYTLAATSLALLAACGGGGGGGGGGGNTQISAPVVTVYEDIDIGATVFDRVLQTCNATASQIQIMSMTYDPAVQRFTTYRFFVDGSLSLPNAPGRCSITEMTGNVTAVRLTIDGGIAYSITGVNIDASNLLYGSRYFWSALSDAASTIQASSPSQTSRITCTNTQGQRSAVTLTMPGDIRSFIRECVS
jgi:hypothetical protein